MKLIDYVLEIKRNCSDLEVDLINRNEFNFQYKNEKFHLNYDKNRKEFKLTLIEINGLNNCPFNLNQTLHASTEYEHGDFMTLWWLYECLQDKFISQNDIFDHLTDIDRNEKINYILNHLNDPK